MQERDIQQDVVKQIASKEIQGAVREMKAYMENLLGKRDTQSQSNVEMSDSAIIRSKQQANAASRVPVSQRPANVEKKTPQKSAWKLPTVSTSSSSDDESESENDSEANKCV